MPKQRQRTLREFADNSISAKQSRRKTRTRVIEVDSDDSTSDPGRIQFERQSSKGHDPANTEDDPSAQDGSISVSSLHSVSPQRDISWSSGRLARNKRIVVSSDESDGQRITKRRRLFKGKRPELRREESEEENLIDELDQDRILASRLRTRTKKTSDFARSLERLQRRRRGETTPSDNQESGDDESSSPCGASPQDLEETRPSLNQEEDKDDFITDDDNADEVPELPTMYSMGTYQDLSHHFKVLDPLKFTLNHVVAENYFSVPLTIVQRKLSAIKDSLVTSSIWKPDFKKPLESFPDFRLETLDFSIPLCDACHIGSRIATLRGVISGHRYDRLTFERLAGNNFATEEDGSSEIEWNLGRFCAARAQVFHLFSHWEYTLYHSLHEEVNLLQEALHSSSEKGFRVFPPDKSGKSSPNPRDADEIMDWLDARGIISVQWAKVKNMMDRARKLEGKKEAQEDLDIFF